MTPVPPDLLPLLTAEFLAGYDQGFARGLAAGSRPTDRLVRVPGNLPPREYVWESDLTPSEAARVAFAAAGGRVSVGLLLAPPPPAGPPAGGGA
jgi:hypothetical protein